MNLQTRYDLERATDALARRLDREVEPYASWPEPLVAVLGESQAAPVLWEH
jgi:hypothetical protein